MSAQTPTQRPGDKMKKAICAFSELIREHPDKSRVSLLHQVEIQFDLSPKECEFLDNKLTECQNEK
ncbi:MAG: hypothetical protein PHZ02_10540 [Desulfocapsaceae bacterium]|nr:hypothetical protein [Desulfocapsaceae bacterium]